MIYLALAAAFIALVVVGQRMNRKTCIIAFGRGIHDAELPFVHVVKNYSGYFSPLRPMDAAAYRLGVSYLARFVVGEETRDPKTMFSDSWRLIVEEGTAVRHLVKLVGLEHASALLSLPIGAGAMKILEEDLSLSPVEAIAREHAD